MRYLYVLIIAAMLAGGCKSAPAPSEAKSESKQIEVELPAVRYQE